MNYSFITWMEYFIGSFICCLGLFFSGTIISYKKFKNIKYYHYLLIIIFSVFMIFNTLIFNNVAKIFGMLLILYLLFKIIYKENNKYTLIISVITYIICIISEVSFSIITVLVGLFFDLNLILETVRTIIGNFIIAVFSCMYAYFFRKKLKTLIKKLNENAIIYILILSIITILVVFSSMFSLYLNEWQIDYGFILNIIIIFGGLYLLFILIKQNIKNKEITNKYDGLREYMKTSADLIEKYSSTVHKYKNNLIAIKGYLKTNVNYADKYIDKLLDDFKTKKYAWFSKINYINFDSIRYLVYYKLSKAEEKNLKIMVTVSKDIKSLDSESLNLNESSVILEIIGEYFDNAIYASNESNEKELNFNMYLADKKIVFEIVNSYVGKINLDLISRNGYTTKGKGHGIGLYEIDKVLKGNKFLHNSIEIVDNYFIVRLFVNF